MKKPDDKEKTEKESTSDKMKSKIAKNEETLNSLLSAQQKANYLLSKELIEQYKNFCEELVKQEQLYMQKIEEAKKKSKARSGSAGRIRVMIPKNKSKDMKNRTNKSSYGIGRKIEEGQSILNKNKLIESMKNKDKDKGKGSSNIKNISSNEN